MAMNPNEQNNNHEAVPKENMWKRQEDNNWAEKARQQELRKRKITNIIFWICAIAVVGGIVCGIVFYALSGGFHTEHEFGEWEVVREATCLENGIKERTCKCGEVQQREIIGDHIAYEENDTKLPICRVCGETFRLSSEGLEFTHNEDILNEGNKGYSVSGIGTCTDTDIIIPKVYNGEYVTRIDYKAFKDCASLTSITIPDSVTVIGYSAFENCKSLVSINSSWPGSVVIPDSVLDIGDSAFRNCDLISNVKIGKSVTTIVDEAFYDCNSLRLVEIPSSVIFIGNGAFADCESLIDVIIDPDSKLESLLGRTSEEFLTTDYGRIFSRCSSLTSIVIPDSVVFIGRETFSECTSLTSITIGKGLTQIVADAFMYCDSIENVHYNGDIESWCDITFNDFVGRSENGVNFYIGDELITDLIISDGVTKIRGNTFRNFTSIKSVTIPNSVTSIGGSAFCGCTSLTSVNIPDSVTSIGNDAFYSCKSLTTINFEGTVEEWNAITKGSFWSKAYNSSRHEWYQMKFTVYCIDGEVLYGE